MGKEYTHSREHTWVSVCVVKSKSLKSPRETKKEETDIKAMECSFCAFKKKGELINMYKKVVHVVPLHQKAWRRGAIYTDFLGESTVMCYKREIYIYLCCFNNTDDRTEVVVL